MFNYFLKKNILVSLFIIITSTFHFSSVTYADDSDIVKVVYHADFADPRRFSAMLTSINNMATYYETELQEYDIRIVFVAHGIRFVTDNKLENTPFAEDKDMAERRGNNKARLLNLNDNMGVKLELCEITRSQIGLDKTKLYEGTESVPSGVVRLAELQQQGFSYLKVE